MQASKPYQFKAPPRLNKLFPLLLSYSIDLRTSKSSEYTKRLHIDFSSLEEIDALGLSIFATNLAKEVRKHGVFEFQIKYPEDAQLAKSMAKIDVRALFLRLGLQVSQTVDLWENTSSFDISQNHFQSFDGCRQALLFISNKTADDGRHALTKIRKSLKNFYDQNPCDTINYKQVHHIIDEMIKNTLDHSKDDSVTAIKFEGSKKKGKLNFVHCELGDGISLNVRNFLATNTDRELQRLSVRGSTADFLHWAFLPGHTSKPNSGVNAGLGLAHIQSAARGGNIELYFSDAQSLAYVSDFPEVHSHKQLRKRLYHSNPIPCFMYFGETR